MGIYAAITLILVAAWWLHRHTRRHDDIEQLAAEARRRRGKPTP